MAAMRRRYRCVALLCLGAALIAAIPLGCASDRRIGSLVSFDTFGGRWWNYYERGKERLDAGDYAAATSDFRTALDGRSRDAWKARTYGLRFQEYFASRELGVALYEQGNLDEAEQYLNRSLEAVDTERAHYYLDQITRTRLQQGALTDTAAPTIAATTNGLVNERQLALAVEAQDDVGVAAVRINGEALFQRGSRTELASSGRVLLGEGPQTITIEADDLADKTTTEQVPVTVDLTGPNVGIYRPLPGDVIDAASVTLEGVAVDLNGIAGVTLDGAPLGEGTGERIAFTRDLPLQPGENTFVIIARDAAGNETYTDIRIFRGNPATAGAQLWRVAELRPELLQVAANGTLDFAQIAQAAEAPVENGIVIKYPKPDVPYRHNTTLRVVGEVVAAAGVQSVAINGQAFEPLTGAPRESFNKRLPLDSAQTAGPVDVQIAAQTADGAALEQSLTVNVQPVELNDPESRMPVAVLAFGANGLEQSIGDGIRERLDTTITGQGRFQVVNRAALEQVLTEQQLSQALGDPNAALDIGRVIPAQVFLTGAITAWGDAGLEIAVKAVSTETTTQIAVFDAFVEDRNSFEQVSAGCAKISEQLTQAFPRLSGEVLVVRNGNVFINWTEADGVKPNTYCLLVNEVAIEDPITGEVFGTTFDVLGRARVRSVSDNFTEAQPLEEGINLEQGLPAVTM